MGLCPWFSSHSCTQLLAKRPCGRRPPSGERNTVLRREMSLGTTARLVVDGTMRRLGQHEHAATDLTGAGEFFRFVAERAGLTSSSAAALLSDYAQVLGQGADAGAPQMASLGLAFRDLDKLHEQPYDAHTNEFPAECPICYVAFKQNQRMKVLPCAHAYCAACTTRWFTGNTTCPLCRKDCRSIRSPGKCTVPSSQRGATDIEPTAGGTQTGTRGGGRSTIFPAGVSAGHGAPVGTYSPSSMPGAHANAPPPVDSPRQIGAAATVDHSSSQAAARSAVDASQTAAVSASEDGASTAARPSVTPIAMSDALQTPERVPSSRRRAHDTQASDRGGVSPSPSSSSNGAALRSPSTSRPPSTVRSPSTPHSPSTPCSPSTPHSPSTPRSPRSPPPGNPRWRPSQRYPQEGPSRAPSRASPRSPVRSPTMPSPSRQARPPLAAALAAPPPTASVRPHAPHSAVHSTSSSLAMPPSAASAVPPFDDTPTATGHAPIAPPATLPSRIPASHDANSHEGPSPHSAELLASLVALPHRTGGMTALGGPQSHSAQSPRTPAPPPPRLPFMSPSTPPSAPPSAPQPTVAAAISATPYLPPAQRLRSHPRTRSTSPRAMRASGASNLSRGLPSDLSPLSHSALMSATHTTLADRSTVQEHAAVAHLAREIARARARLELFPRPPRPSAAAAGAPTVLTHRHYVGADRADSPRSMRWPQPLTARGSTALARDYHNHHRHSYFHVFGDAC